nr:hypothetical protein CFP56_78468 [Quercus suber]
MDSDLMLANTVRRTDCHGCVELNAATSSANSSAEPESFVKSRCSSPGVRVSPFSICSQQSVPRSKFGRVMTTHGDCRSL